MGEKNSPTLENLQILYQPHSCQFPALILLPKHQEFDLNNNYSYEIIHAVNRMPIINKIIFQLTEVGTYIPAVSNTSSL